MRAPSGVFSTLLVFMVFFFSAFSIAEPIFPDPTVNKPHSDADEGPPQSTTPLQPMDIANPPPEKASKTDSYFYRYQSGLSINAGPYGMTDDNGIFQIYSLLGFTYLWNSQTSVHMETGVETVTLGEGHIWTMARFQSNTTMRWRPFYGVGIGVRVVPDRGLATFLQLKDYFPRLSAGAEYGFSDAHSLRGEIAAAADFQGHPLITLTVGYSYGLQ